VEFTPGTRDVDTEAAIADHIIVGEERPVLVSLVRALQQASEPADFYRLQRKPFPRAEVQRTQQLLDTQEFAERCCKAVTHALRCVGDGIAWKALRYDRAAISVLGSGKRVGRLADGKGLDAELEAVAEYWWKDGSFAIHNDLTNCLRTGDLTLPFEPGGRVAIREVKSGSARRTAQTKAAEERIAFLRKGRGPVMGADSAQLARFAVRVRTDLHVLRRLLADARRDGYARAQPSSSTVVVTVDPRVSRGEPGIDVVTDQARAGAGWYDDPRIVRTLTMVRRARERLHHYPYLAPLTVFPLPAEDIAELVFGPLEYITILHAPTLERELAARGIHAEVVTRKPEADRVFLRAVRADAQVELPALVREQLLTELMQPACLIDSLHSMFELIDDGGALGATLVCLADEAGTWS
jgi:hypothetical protein